MPLVAIGMILEDVMLSEVSGEKKLKDKRDRWVRFSEKEAGGG